MYYNKVEICGVNTSDLKVLSDEEKRSLLLRTKDGDESARQELIYGNLRLVLSIIQRFTGRRENLDDLFQVGCIGLCKAVDNFKVELDVKFSTYAVPMIIGEIRRYLRDNNSIRISRSMRDLAYKALQKLFIDAYKNFGFDITFFKNSPLSQSFVTLHLPLPVIASFFPKRSFFSKRVTLAPFKDAYIAPIMPAGPPPIIAISLCPSCIRGISFRFYLD